MNVEETLAERQGTHGDFAVNAAASQALKNVVELHGIQSLTPVQAEAIDNICQKIARIITGNPNHADNWHDIVGYATLAENAIDNP
jgi:superfamily II DNA/RNA helicase